MRAFTGTSVLSRAIIAAYSRNYSSPNNFPRRANKDRSIAVCLCETARGFFFRLAHLDGRTDRQTDGWMKTALICARAYHGAGFRPRVVPKARPCTQTSTATVYTAISEREATFMSAAREREREREGKGETKAVRMRRIPKEMCF